MATDMQVANTILEQLGGRRFIVMTGAFGFIGSADHLSFRLKSNPKRITHVKITLDPSDTYTVKFSRLRGVDLKIISLFKGVYADNLQEIFTSATGLYTRLNPPAGKFGNKNPVYEYFINLDERGDFSADVRNSNGKTVFDIEGGEIFEDGFMRHKNDIAGLEGYLKELGIIPKGGRLISGQSNPPVKHSRRIMGYVLYWKEGAALHHSWFQTKSDAYEFTEKRKLHGKITALRPEFAQENPSDSDLKYVLKVARAGTPEWLAAKSSGPVHEYEDARGVKHTGYMGHYSDRGGTDQTAFMYDRETGELSLVSGSRLKKMKTFFKNPLTPGEYRNVIAEAAVHDKIPKEFYKGEASGMRDIAEQYRENPNWKPIDNNHYIISGKLAGQLAGGKFPRPGNEKLVTYEGKNYWLKKLPYQGKPVWMLYGPTDWKMRGPVAVLGNPMSKLKLKCPICKKNTLHDANISGRALQCQVCKHDNYEVLQGRIVPLRREQGNPPATKIYSHCIEIRASKAGMPHKCDAACKRSNHLYKHEFKKRCCIFGLPDGSLLIK